MVIAGLGISLAIYVLLRSHDRIERLAAILSITATIEKQRCGEGQVEGLIAIR